MMRIIRGAEERTWLSEYGLSLWELFLNNGAVAGLVASLGWCKLPDFLSWVLVGFLVASCSL
jgi:hypothetical protein